MFESDTERCDLMLCEMPAEYIVTGDAESTTMVCGDHARPFPDRVLEIIDISSTEGQP